jgi:tetratricopeptide (TPR) repeat protein
MVLAHVGLLDEAEEHVRIAVGINPNNTMARFRVGAYTAWQCRFDEALAILRTVPGGTSPMLIDRTRAEVLIQLGRHGHARDIVDNHLDAHPTDEGGSFTSLKALLLAQEGAAREADRMIAQAITIGEGFGHFHHTAYNIASAYAALDRPDEAVGWLQVAADDGFPCYPYFNGDPNLKCLHGHPGFVDLMSALHRRWAEFGARPTAAPGA